ncbi:MAG TPA: S-layer homology domain-containing protein [Syntrophomonadaceae bacterium]|nr:S-layer homology domain-containing protein [Syntrophomonadaceae bacterium]
MRRVSAVLLTLMFMLSMVVSPALAKGGGGNGGGSSGHGSQGAASVNSGQGNHGVTSTNSGKGNTVTKNANSPTSSNTLKTSHTPKTVNTDLVSDFSDTSGHWASNAVKTLKSLSIIRGYDDGTFRPDDPISNTEALVMVVQTADLLDTDVVTDQEESAAPNEDTTDADAAESEADQVPAWAQPAVTKAESLKIINVNRFHSQVQADRAQTAVMLAKALNLQPVTNGEIPFSDVGYMSGEDLGYLVALQQLGIIHGSPDGKFNPNSSITRAEIAAMLAQVVQPSGDGTDTDTTDTSTTDTSTTDTGSTDTGSTDTGSTNTGSTDTGSTNTGSTDTGATDTGTADTGAGITNTDG